MRLKANPAWIPTKNVYAGIMNIFSPNTMGIIDAALGQWPKIAAAAPTSAHGAGFAAKNAVVNVKISMVPET